MSRLTRWSQRKRGLETPPETASPASPPEAAPSCPRSPGPEGAPGFPPEATREAQAPQAPGSRDAELPDPESLPPGSDMTDYLREGVSQALRRRALRQLWRAPHYQLRDGLDDYDDDYSQLMTLSREAAERLRPWIRRADAALEALAEDEPATDEAAPDSADDENASR